MKKLSILLLLLSISFLSPISAYAQDKLVNPYPCLPDNGLECLMDVLENDLNDPKFNTSNEKALMMPSFYLAMGYSKLKDYKNSEKYRKKSIALAKKHGEKHLQTGRILEQYIMDGKESLVSFIIQNKTLSTSECFSLTQTYLYNKDFEKLSKLLKGTSCTIDYIHIVCYQLDKKDITGFLKNTYKTLPKTLISNPHKKKFEMEASQCLAGYIRNQSRNDEILSFKEVIKEFGFSFSDKAVEDSLRMVILREALIAKDFETAIEEIKAIETPALKLDAHKRFINTYTYIGDIKALEQNKKVQDYYRSLNSKHKQKNGGEEYKAAYAGSGFSDIKSVLLFDITDPKFRLTKMKGLLDHLVTFQIEGHEYPNLKRKCGDISLDICIFNEVQTTYDKIDDKEKEDQRRSSPFNLYLQSNVLIGNYDYLREHAPNPENNFYVGMISKKRTDCTIFLADTIRDIKDKISAGIPESKYYSTLRHVAQCLYTSGDYKEIVRGKRDLLSTMIINTIPSRMIMNPKNVLHDIKIASLDIPPKSKERIIDQAIYTLRTTKSSDQKVLIANAVEAFLKISDNYNHRQINNLQSHYSTHSLEGRRDNLLSDIPRFSIERTKKENSPRSTKPTLLRHRVSQTGGMIYSKVQEDREFIPKYRSRTTISRF